MQELIGYIKVGSFLSPGFVLWADVSKHGMCQDLVPHIRVIEVYVPGTPRLVSSPRSYKTETVHVKFSVFIYTAD